MTRFQELLVEVRALNLPAEQFAVFGSGPMAVHGILDRDVNDIDIIVMPSLWEQLARVYPPEEHEHGLLRIQVGTIELLNGWYPSVGEVAALIADAKPIDGIRYVQLEKVLEWKRLRGKEKDRRDIELLLRHLHAADLDIAT